MKKILVPIDFSQVAQNALDEAAHLAKRMSAELIIMHVLEEGASTGSARISGVGEYKSDDPQEQIFMLKLIEKSLERLSIVSEAYEGITISTELRLGNAFHGITDIIKDRHVDLVVMGTTGSSGIDELLVGSNAEKVVRYANCPVLTINEKTGKSTCDNIVLATSMTEKENKLISIIKEIQGQYNSRIHLLWINTPNNFQRDKNTKAKLEEYAKGYGLTNYTINIYNDFTEEEGIVSFGEEINSDLIAMVTHRRTGIAHLIAGSIAEDVVNHSKRPVLTSGVN